MKVESLRKLMLEELKDVYDAEQQITKALPKMIKEAESDELRAAFEEHLEVTEGQIERLEEIFENLGQKPQRSKCEGMKGLLDEGKELLEKDAEPEVLDAGMIVAAQKVEHYEIAAYGSLRTFANLLGDKKSAALLQESLDEEKEADQKLSELAEHINVQAARAAGA